MNKHDGLKLTGDVNISVNNIKTGKSTNYNYKNLIVTVGKNWVASRMQGVVDSVMTHMEIGTGTTAAAIGDTTIETATTPAAARVALTQSGGVASTNTLTFNCTFPADTPDVTAPATASITEAGVFNASSGGTMAARTVFPVINKGESDTMTVSWVVTIS